MNTSLKQDQSGFTIIELLVVIVMLAILSVLSINFYSSSQARSRDVNRLAEIGTIQRKLEEYANANNGGYPNTFTVSTFTGLDGEVLKDSNDKTIKINAIVAKKEDAEKVNNPTLNGDSQYLYIPIGKADCTNNCSGYILKSFIESPTNLVSNPYKAESQNTIKN